MYVAFARRHPAVGEVLLSELPMSSDDLNSLDFLIFHQVGEWERQHGELRTVLHLRAVAPRVFPHLSALLARL